MSTQTNPPLLTVAEVAEVLRCSKPHAYNLIAGKVAGASPLPALVLGRRKLVRREALEEWIKANERNAPGGMIRPPEADAVRRVGGNHA